MFYISTQETENQVIRMCFVFWDPYDHIWTWVWHADQWSLNSPFTLKGAGGGLFDNSLEIDFIVVYDTQL